MQWVAEGALPPAPRKERIQAERNDEVAAGQRERILEAIDVHRIKRAGVAGVAAPCRLRREEDMR
ncbi:MAG: hypothetical protein U0892_17715 [Pirellulales bacterium]